ncbi:hypothetical protein ACFVIM_34135 [Streptomyces sp. NPDC057638]|uniref:hypothetical protein n=1 Tax=Streptomyces sp. NPDC057638 TaxID=3346190 RepID=UPI0036A97108
MPERSILDWYGPGDRPLARIYSRWAPPPHQLPALADCLAEQPEPHAASLDAYRQWAHAHAPHLISAVIDPAVPETPVLPDYRYTVRTNPLRITARVQRAGVWTTLLESGDLGDLHAEAARLLAEQALRIRALREPHPHPPFAIHLGDPARLEAAAVRHETSAAAAGWHPDHHPA